MVEIENSNSASEIGRPPTSPTNKARIRDLMPEILSLREQGYFLTDIYKWLREQRLIGCTKSNFDRYYYSFLPDFEGAPSSAGEQTQA